MKHTFFFLTTISALFISACNKDETIEAGITFTEPSDTDTVMYNEELHIEGTIQGNGKMHGYMVKIYNPVNDSIFFTKSYHEHNEQYLFHEHWMNSCTDTTNLSVQILVDLTHSSTLKRELSIVCLPQ